MLFFKNTTKSFLPWFCHTDDKFGGLFQRCQHLFGSFEWEKVGVLGKQISDLLYSEALLVTFCVFNHKRYKT